MPVRIPKKLLISAAVTAEINALAAAGYPHEVCGVLIGGAPGGDVQVERIAACRNLATDRLADRFVLDPNDFNAADDAARRDGLDIVGIWHTHPDHPGQPSPTDLEAAWPHYSYLIVSVTAAGVAEHRSWQLVDKRFIEQEIEELETCQT